MRRSDGLHLSVMRDITERKRARSASDARNVGEGKRAEGTLLASEERYRTLVEQSPDGILVIDTDLRIGDANTAACAMLGCERDELIGRPWAEFIPPEELAVNPIRFQESREDPVLTLERTLRRQDGTLLPVEVRGRKAADGRYVHIVRDITERKRSKEALEKSEAHFRSLFENMLEGFAYCRMIFTGDQPQDFVYLEVNRKFEELTGLRDVVGKRVTEVIPGIRESNPELFEIYGRVVRTGTAASFETYLGDVGWLSISVFRPEREHFIAVFDNITARKQAEAQRELLEAHLRQAAKMETVGQLAGGIAHDFNNLLTAIRGYAELLEPKLPADDAASRTDLGEIIAAADRAAALTRQLLAFSRRQILQPQVLDPAAIVEGLAPMLRRLLGEHIELATSAKPGLGSVRVDPSQLEQVIVNLAVNARDAMPEGGRLTIETANVELDAEYVRGHLEATSGPHVLLAVSDTGTGMDHATQARLFEPFFTTKPEGEGTGLGLATIYGIVKQSDGSIYVYSEPGQGTTFKIYLPRVVEEQAADCSTTVEVAPPPTGSETILLVEDDPAVRTFASRVLGDLGYSVIEAPGATVALALAAAHPGPIELLLTDIVMPRVSGPELAERLMAERPGVRVVFMSGYGMNHLGRSDAIEADVACLPKPFTAETLARAVREALDRAAGE